MKKSLFIVGLFCILLIVSLFAFKKDDKEERIVVAEVTHSVFYTPYYVSIHNGYFEEEGLNIETILTSGADKVASAVISGDANIGLSGLEATLYVYQNNAKDYLMSFSSLTKRDGQFLFGDCSLKDSFSVNDLKGKSVLAGRKGGMPSMVFMYALYKNNVSNVYVDNSVEFANLSSAYIAGEGDFVNLFEPNASSLEKEGYGCVLSSIGLMSGEVPYTVFHSKKSYIENNEEVIRKFVRAIKKGMEFVRDNNEEEIAKVIKDEFIDLDINDLATIVKRYKDADSWYYDTIIREEAYNNLLNLMEYNNAIEQRVNFNTLVTNNYSE